MAITDNSGNFTTVEAYPDRVAPWTVSAYTADATACETIKAAPGANLSLYIRDILIQPLADSGTLGVTIGYGKSGNAVEAPIIGPLKCTIIGNSTQIHFERPIKLPANKALTIDADAAGAVAIVVQGATGP